MTNPRSFDKTHTAMLRKHSTCREMERADFSAVSVTRSFFSKRPRNYVTESHAITITVDDVYESSHNAYSRV